MEEEEKDVVPSTVTQLDQPKEQDAITNSSKKLSIGKLDSGRLRD